MSTCGWMMAFEWLSTLDGMTLPTLSKLHTSHKCFDDEIDNFFNVIILKETYKR